MTWSTSVIASSADPQSDLAGPALRAFFSIAERWRLTPDQRCRLLGSSSQGAFLEWERERAGPIPDDVLVRISYILGIYKALRTLFSNAEQADTWISQANTARIFGGGTALERMLGGELEDLRLVRNCLDADAMAHFEPNEADSTR